MTTIQSVVRTLLIGILLVIILKNWERMWNEIKIRVLLLIRRYRQAGNIVYYNMPDNKERAISIYSKAATEGSVEAMIPLGKLFEAADQPDFANMVYDVMEQRTRDVNPYMNAYANERLDLLNANRREYVNPNAVPVITLQTTNLPKQTIAPVTPKPPPEVKIQNDPQNVHDSGTVKTVANSYNRLKEATSTSNITLESCLKELRGYIQKDSKAYSSDALKALDKIESSTSPITSLNNDKEVDVLLAVWRRISTNHDDSAKEVLVKQLSESRTTCTSGRVSRIIDTLNIIDPLVEIKPRWAHRQEILDLASNLRNHYDSDEDFKTALRVECKKQYVDSGLMTQQILDTELNSWIDNI